MELVKLYGAILRRRWVLLQAVVFFTLAGLVAAMTLPKTYQATAKMMGVTSDTSLSVLAELGLSEVAQGLSGSSEDIQNHIALATTRPILEQLVWRLQLRNSSGDLLNPEKLLIPGMTGALDGAPLIEIKQHQSSDIILVTATTADPELSRLMADTLVRLYIAETQSTARRETREARIFVEGRLEIVRDELEAALTEISDAKMAADVLDLDAEVRAGVAQLSELMMASEENASRIQEVRAQIGAVRSSQSLESSSFMGPGTVAANSDIRALRSERLKIIQQRDVLVLEKTSKHLDVLKLDTALVSLDNELGLALKEQHMLDPQLLKLQTELSGLRDRGKELQAGLERTSARFRSYPEKMRTLSQLEVGASAAEEVYRSLQGQKYQIAIAEAMTVSPLQFVEPAVRPERPVFPKLVPNLVVGFGLGVLFGLGLVAAFEYVDDSIKSSEELRDFWDLPLLGLIPKFRLTGEQTGLISERSPTDPVVESYRTLRSAIEFSTLDNKAKMLLVTSSLPEEGKSTLSSNLAISSAADGRRVLVVDCDLRRPRQHRFWPGMSNDVGLTSVLLGQLEAKDAIKKTTVEGFDLLTSGPVPPNPGRLVESLKLRQLLLELSKSYDLVIIDTPPLLVVNDAMIISRLVDHTLLVVEAGGTTKRVLSEVREQLRSGGMEPLGLIFNKVGFNAGYGYTYYARRAYQTYYREDGNPQSGGGAA
jgi:capsular exopolysaccharide synthesis family protein